MISGLPSPAGDGTLTGRLRRQRREFALVSAGRDHT